ncbi:hypothetical protein [Salipaludibacillus daqingensis]|uniref:hypothetical protein n=1 Tax=Salipaludibacillus daqingensis TaxID=3041001 RepID=UPI0024730F2C|nr:hypothetical protein [Salipaludibacillus daqingensis]
MNTDKRFVSLKVLENSENLYDRFESAFRSVARTYIECTPIEISNIYFQRSNNQILVIYDYNNLELKYLLELEDGAMGEHAKLPNGEIVDSFMEFWIKWVVEGFFSEELKVEAKHIDITFHDGTVTKKI